MSEQKHTPEPWKVSVSAGNGVAIRHSDDRSDVLVCIVRPQFARHHGFEQAKANARYIVACVNACALASIPDPATAIPALVRYAGAAMQAAIADDDWESASIIRDVIASAPAGQEGR